MNFQYYTTYMYRGIINFSFGFHKTKNTVSLTVEKGLMRSASDVRIS